MSQHEEWVMNQARISELKAENVQLREIINAHNKKMSEGVYTTNEQCAKEVAEHDSLLTENAAQAKRIAELESELVEWNEFKKIRDAQMQALRNQARIFKK